MNYIKTLQETIEQNEKTMQVAHDEISDLMSYLMSEKFHNDTTVQVKDVLTRLMPVRSILTSSKK